LSPDHAPEAVHAVAFALLQASVELAPLAIVLGLAVMRTLGAVALTDTLTVCDALPPAPSQFKVYAALADNAPVDCDPLSGLVPDHEPTAVQAVAFCVDQVSIEPAPAVTELGSTFSVICGARAETVTVTD
jgi:hypothetical protein